ncbi:MAG: hypothetical protein KAJ29_06075 [Alphaproteobacteria bacterium]|nr:hypothetical protein [Alphaproteobacteria bacterium]
MTMTGVILTIVASGFVSLFISHTFLRNRIGLGMAVMFLMPMASCAIYIFLTAPRYNPPAVARPSQVLEQTINKEEHAMTLAPEDIAALEKIVEENPDDIDSVFVLTNAYMSLERYDSAISLLKSRQMRFHDKKLVTLLTIAHFAKGLLLAEQGKFKQALSSLRDARKIAPEDAPFLPDLDHFIARVEGLIPDVIDYKDND